MQPRVLHQMSKSPHTPWPQALLEAPLMATKVSSTLGEHSVGAPGVQPHTL